MIEDFISLFQTEFYLKIWHYFFVTWPLWVPLALVTLLLNTWFSYKRREWIKEQGRVLLEIKLPKDIARSPAAMEEVLAGMWEDVVGSAADVFLSGRVRDWFSLEIVSVGGEVKFFIWAFPKWKKIIETRVYAQYPGAEVFEAEDYAEKVIFDPNKMKIFGLTTKLVKADAYPIKTYIDYELDKSVGKEQEEIVDPLSQVLEYLGSLNPGEQAWIQILIQAHRKQKFLDDATIFSKPDWKGGIKQEIQKIIEKESLSKPSKPDEAGNSFTPITFLTRTQDKTIESIERNAGKLAFESMVRLLYTAPLDVYDKMKHYGLVGSMRQFGSQNLNGIRPDVFIPGINYPWQDFRDIRKMRTQRLLLDSYKRRSFFNVPYKHLYGRPYILTTEELSTIFHFPGATTTTPTLTRVPSKKSAAPANLPM